MFLLFSCMVVGDSALKSVMSSLKEGWGGVWNAVWVDYSIGEGTQVCPVPLRWHPSDTLQGAGLDRQLLSGTRCDAASWPDLSPLSASLLWSPVLRQPGLSGGSRPLKTFSQLLPNQFLVCKSIFFYKCNTLVKVWIHVSQYVPCKIESKWVVEFPSWLRG